MKFTVISGDYFPKYRTAREIIEKNSRATIISSAAIRDALFYAKFKREFDISLWTEELEKEVFCRFRAKIAEAIMSPNIDEIVFVDVLKGASERDNLIRCIEKTDIVLVEIEAKL